MTDDLFRIVYCSHNLIPASGGDLVAEVDTILATCRSRNGREGVTGALIYSDLCFAQVLEGPYDAVHQTFERIQCDPRHGDVVVLKAERTGARLFGKWDMALAQPADATVATETLTRVLGQPNGQAGTEVLELIHGVVRDEAGWGQAPE